MNVDQSTSAYWSLAPAALAARLGTTLKGLPASEADRRLRQFGPNALREGRSNVRLDILWRQVRSPLLLLLLFAAAASMLSGEWLDAGIVVVIVVTTVWIGYTREYRAHATAAALRERLDSRATALRDGTPTPVRTETIVVGDVVVLSAGSLVPAACWSDD